MIDRALYKKKTKQKSDHILHNIDLMHIQWICFQWVGLAADISNYVS